MIWAEVSTDFIRKHGPMPGLPGAVVIGMGSMGAARLNAGSDLDLIVIYDDQGVEGSDGPPAGDPPLLRALTGAGHHPDRPDAGGAALRG